MPPQGSKPDWICKSCLGPDGKAYRNFGFRSACKLCNIGKGTSFGGPAASSKPPAQRTYAAQQVQAQKKDERAQQQQPQQKAHQRLQQEVAKLKQELQAARTKDSDKNSEDDNDKDLKELERRKLLYAKLPGEEQKVKDLEARIAECRGAKASSLPDGEKLKRAEQALAKKTKKKAALDEEVKALREKLASKQEDLATSEEEEKLAAQEVEKIKKEISTGNSKQPSMPPYQPPSFADGEGCLEAIKILPPTFLPENGLDAAAIDTYSDILKRMQLLLSAEAAKKQQAEEAKAELHKQQQAAQAAADKAAKEAVPAGSGGGVQGGTRGSTLDSLTDEKRQQNRREAAPMAVDGESDDGGPPAAKVAKLSDSSVDLAEFVADSSPERRAELMALLANK